MAVNESINYPASAPEEPIAGDFDYISVDPSEAGDKWAFDMYVLFMFVVSLFIKVRTIKER